jgi:AraC-like DNA-binding protein
LARVVTLPFCNVETTGMSRDVGYKNPSDFAQVFRRIVGVTPTEFRSAL